jgi:hypothetical protein
MGMGLNFAAENRTVGKRPVGPVAVALLRKVWAIHLRRSGFRDLERAENPDAPLSSTGYPTRTALCPDVFGRFGERDGRTVEDYRRMGRLAWRFEDEIDQQIALALSEAETLRAIKARLGVGQTRMERVAKQLRIWMNEPEEDSDG